MVATDVAIASTCYLAITNQGPYILTGIIAAGLYIWQSVDAVLTANEKNKKNGYIVSIAPCMQYNALAVTNNSSGITPSLSMTISF